VAPSAAIASGQASTAELAQTTPAQPDPATEQAEAAREGLRTYTGGRRNEPVPSAADTALAPGQPIKGVIVKGGGPNKAAQGALVPPTGTAKSISEKGVSSTKSR
jgi:hypothetical protein